MADGGTVHAPRAFADMTALRSCWHPVAFARAVRDRPFDAVAVAYRKAMRALGLATSVPAVR
jgi:hypothetical protein